MRDGPDVSAPSAPYPLEPSTAKMTRDTLYAVVAVNISQRQRIGLLSRFSSGGDERRGAAEQNPLFHPYHYAIPRALSEQLIPGQLLWVPFGSEQRQGLLLGFAEEAPVTRVRPLHAIAQAEPFLQPHMIDLARRISERYLAPLWDTLLLMLPPGVLQGTERIVTRTGRAVTAPLSRDARRVLAWIETQGGESTMKLIAEVLGNEAEARRAVSTLLEAGLLQDRLVMKRPGIRPRTERFVSLAVEGEELGRRFSTLGRESRQADILDALGAGGGELPLDTLLERTGTHEGIIDALVEKGYVERLRGTFVQRVRVEGSVPLTAAQKEALAWLDNWPERERLPLQAMRDGGIAAVTIRALEEKGQLRVLEEAPERVRLLIPSYRLQAVTDELRGSSIYRVIVRYLAGQSAEITTGELYEVTGATGRHLDVLEAHGLLRVERREVLRNPLAGRTIPASEPPTFTPEQVVVWSALERALKRHSDRDGQIFLLHGVTGSGKTEVYLRAVAEALAQGKQAIVLVPEIALTPQTIARFGARFGELIALQHSRLSQGERYDEWRRLRDGRAQIAIGSRSAIFAPVPEPGVIVIDEEHEWTYKQGNLPGYHFPHYHVRDVAEMLAQLTGATVILGSATPSLESYYRAEQGRYQLLEMGERVVSHLASEHERRAEGAHAAAPATRASSGGGGENTPESHIGLSPVQIVDMRQELRVGNTSILSRELKRALRHVLDARQQAILFLNRRGAHSFVMCRDCGWVQECERCDVPMSSHRGLDYLICHQCNSTRPLPHHCPACLSLRVKHFGVGTQQVEDVTRAAFPEARVLRWDRDTARGKGAHERLLARFAAGQADILVGTQMIAKGLDLPLVTLVGVISADTALHLPDFRSGERTFQLLTQVAGRAGRSMLGGRVILQTYTPLHYAIRSASRHHYHEFYRHEIAFRREHAYPPFAPLLKLLYTDPSPRAAREQAEALAERLRSRCAQLGLPGTEVLGPAPAFFGRLHGRYRWQILIRGTHARALVREALPGVGWEIDVDPLSLL